MSEPSRGAAGAFVSPVIMMIGDVEVSKIDIPEGGIVSYEGRFPMVVEVVPRYSYPVRTTDNVDLSILRLPHEL